MNKFLKLLAIAGAMAFSAGRLAAQVAPDAPAPSGQEQKPAQEAPALQFPAQQPPPAQPAPKNRLKKLYDRNAALKADAEKERDRLLQTLAAAKTQFLRNAVRRELAKCNLLIMRTSVYMYYAQNQEHYPPGPSALVPRYMTAVPELDIPGYAATAEITILKQTRAATVTPLVSDTGGWLYIASPRSKLYGKVFINAKAKLYGKAFCDY